MIKKIIFATMLFNSLAFADSKEEHCFYSENDGYMSCPEDGANIQNTFSVNASAFLSEEDETCQFDSNAGVTTCSQQNVQGGITNQDGIIQD